jgi:hypothetical protein
MRTKSAYRQKEPAAEIPPEPNIPEIKVDGEKPDNIAAVHHESDKPPNAAVAEALVNASTADEATLRLRKQLADLRKAEAFQHQAALQNRPLSHNEKLASWKAAGMSDQDYTFLAENPDMVAHDRLTAAAAHQAAQEGHARDSDAHRKRTRQLFNEHFVKMQSGAPTPPAPEPEFFRPPPAPEPRGAAAYVSAPVSRGEIGGGYREPSLSQVKLTPDEKDIARASGISETEYARQKISMLKKQRSGEIQK